TWPGPVHGTVHWLFNEGIRRTSRVIDSETQSSAAHIFSDHVDRNSTRSSRGQWQYERQVRQEFREFIESRRDPPHSSFRSGWVSRFLKRIRHLIRPPGSSNCVCSRRARLGAGPRFNAGTTTFFLP